MALTLKPRAAEQVLLTPHDVYLFNEGSHFRLYEKMGAHPTVRDGVAGTQFAVWAPAADYVAVIGDFNEWDRGANPLQVVGESGIWAGFVPGTGMGSTYKYHIASRYGGYKVDKTDPFAFHQELPPRTASVVWDLDYSWNDADWMAGRKANNSLNAPMAVYEVHPGSW